MRETRIEFTGPEICTLMFDKAAAEGRIPNDNYQTSVAITGRGDSDVKVYLVIKPTEEKPK